jgi:hypothetical protein
MGLIMEKQKEYRKISELHKWENNPRVVTEEGLERLKKQIEKLGQYKPLLITSDGTVLGGNMRLKVYKQLNIEEVWVHVVNAPTEKEKIEYALSDNDRVGKYNLDMVTNLMNNFPNIELDNFSIDLDAPLTLQDIKDNSNFDPRKEWNDMPEFKQDGTNFYKEITIRFLNKEDYDKFQKLIEQELTEKTKSIWFPKQDFDGLGRNLVFTKDEQKTGA